MSNICAFQDYAAPHRRENRPAIVDIMLDDITVMRGDRVILNSLSLNIYASSITAIVGPSGAGKTTLLATLNGLIKPQSGSILVNELGEITAPETLRAHRSRTSTIFQDHALIDRLSALDNVLMGLADARHPLSPLSWGSEFERRAAAALRDVGLLHLSHARVGNMSGGERQRVGIARALVRSPGLLLGDEPFSAADPALAQRLGNEFRSLVKASGVTVVLVLHQMELARALADRIVGLTVDGIVFDGTPGEFDDDVHDKIFSMPAEAACFHH